MKKKFIIPVSFCLVLLGIIAVYAQFQQTSGGFTGAGSNINSGKIQAVTVEAAKSMPDDALVSLKGHIVRSLGDEKYTFRDATGEIVVEIDNEIWKGVSVGDKDQVEIVGEIDIDKRKVEIDVKSIKKI